MTVIGAAAAAKDVDVREAPEKLSILLTELNGIPLVQLFRLIQFGMAAP